ncbi:hypothetical protein NFI96_008587 [Prochilodus magdalenae]|nr:hypothetical protein NFI96_008587 [Prochilodus magdalenae]
MKPRTCTIPERVSVMNTRHYVAVDYRNLRLQDAGLYQCGDAGVWNHTVNLTVTQDPCCSGPKTVTGYLGETVTISCSYPDQYEENFKNLQKQFGQYFTEVIDTEETQRDRFSISEDRRSRVVSVRIRDVREDDGGVYYCGVWIGGKSVSYLSLYSEIQLRVTGSSILITVCVCVVLLLIGGSALIFYRLRCRRTHVMQTAPTDVRERTGRSQELNELQRGTVIGHHLCYKSSGEIPSY